MTDTHTDTVGRSISTYRLGPSVGWAEWKPLTTFQNPEFHLLDLEFQTIKIQSFWAKNPRASLIDINNFENFLIDIDINIFITVSWFRNGPVWRYPIQSVRHLGSTVKWTWYRQVKPSTAKHSLVQPSTATVIYLHLWWSCQEWRYQYWYWYFQDCPYQFW